MACRMRLSSFLSEILYRPKTGLQQPPPARAIWGVADAQFTVSPSSRASRTAQGEDHLLRYT